MQASWIFAQGLTILDQVCSLKDRLLGIQLFLCYAQGEDKPVHEIHMIYGLGESAGFLFIQVDGQPFAKLWQRAVVIQKTDVTSKSLGELTALQGYFPDKRQVLYRFC